MAGGENIGEMNAISSSVTELYYMQKELHQEV